MRSGPTTSAQDSTWQNSPASPWNRHGCSEGMLASGPIRVNRTLGGELSSAPLSPAKHFLATRGATQPQLRPRGAIQPPGSGPAFPRSDPTVPGLGSLPPRECATFLWLNSAAAITILKQVWPLEGEPRCFYARLLYSGSSTCGPSTCGPSTPCTSKHRSSARVPARAECLESRGAARSHDAPRGNSLASPRDADDLRHSAEAGNAFENQALR